MAPTRTRKKYQGRPEFPVLLTVNEFAHHIGKGREWVLQACKDGRILASQKVGHFYVIAEDTLIRPRYMEGFPNALLDVDLPPEFVLGSAPYEVPAPEYKERPGNKTRDQRSAITLHSFKYIFDTSGYTYRSLRDMTGVSTQTIAKARNGGKVHPSIAIRFAEAFGVDVSELLRYRGD